ncbi:response regulator [Cerasicoccus frondis]|uniref:response regulator n=1 Tax=Cerasicoccus frondis TaxID=490090 RepID=UPI002852B940|nr:response regulator [Cerasicoccus frondis]
MSKIANEVTILLADDDAGHRQLMRRNLKRFKIANDIIEFEDGQGLLDFFRKAQDSGALARMAFVVFLDIRMPRMTGVEVLQELKADPYLKRVPVIMVTTTDDPAEVTRCHELGCSNYVTKPVDYDNFVKAIQNLGLFLSVVQVPRLD